MKKSKKTKDKKYYVMFGFEESNPSNTAYLKIDANSNGQYGIYNIVNSEEYATLFPYENYDSKKGFGTPYDWADFFAEEEELQDWNFHPVKYSKI